VSSPLQTIAVKRGRRSGDGKLYGAVVIDTMVHNLAQQGFITMPTADATVATKPVLRERIQAALDEAGHKNPYCRGCCVLLKLRNLPVEVSARNGQIEKIRKAVLGDCNREGSRKIDSCLLVVAFNSVVSRRQRIRAD